MLKVFYDSVDQIPDGLREHYVESNGRLRLDCPDHNEHVSSLNHKSMRHRERAEAAEAELAKFQGIDPDRVAGLAEELRLSRENERQVLLGAKLTMALAKSRVTAEGMELLSDKLSPRITLETKDGRRQIRVLDEAGNPTDATLADLTAEAIRRWPGAFESQAGFGTGAPTRNGQPGGGSTVSRREFESLGAGARMAKVNAGVRVVD